MFNEGSHLPPMYCYRCHFKQTYAACDTYCADYLERLLRMQGPENVAAFIAEPVVGATLGAVPPVPEYFPKIREICDRYEVLFIADEVMTGFGRTGANFAVDHWGVIPDLIATAKGVSGGYIARRRHRRDELLQAFGATSRTLSAATPTRAIRSPRRWGWPSCATSRSTTSCPTPAKSARTCWGACVDSRRATPSSGTCAA
jgi:4-aminobutyrate aminotransferase-like enzyme